MPEPITRCDCCDIEIPLDHEIIVEVENTWNHERERWRLCKNCCRSHTIAHINTTVFNKTTSN
jgi:hypothetical protein